MDRARAVWLAGREVVGCPQFVLHLVSVSASTNGRSVMKKQHHSLPRRSQNHIQNNHVKLKDDAQTGACILLATITDVSLLYWRHTLAKSSA